MFEGVEEGHVDGEKPVVYRYSREHRLQSAPQIVKDYYAGKMQPVRGFRVLWTNKQNRYILLSLVFFVAVAWIYSGFNKTRGYGKIGTISMELEAFAFDEQIYVSLKLNDKTATKENTPVKINADFYFINNDSLVFDKITEEAEYINGDLFIRTKNIDYDIIRVDVMVKAEDKEKELSTRVRRQ